MEKLDKEDIKDLVKSAGLSRPSGDFVKNVMKNIDEIPLGEKLEYRPLISRRAWVFIGLSILGIFSLLLLLSGDSVSTFYTIRMYLPTISFKNTLLSEAKMYHSTVYGVLFFIVMFVVQINFIKRKLDQRFSV